MSLISGSYSRLLCPDGAALLRDDMVENEDAVVVRGVAGVEGVVRKRAVGLIALLTTPDRERRFREAVLHSVRLKADMTSISFLSHQTTSMQSLARRDCRTGRACGGV